MSIIFKGFAGLSVLVSTIWAASTAQADLIDDCVQTQDTKLQVSACTDAIESGQWSGKDLIWAFANRDTGHYLQKNYALAIQDYTWTIEQDETYVKGYRNRGLALSKLRKHRRAIEDFDMALRLDPKLAAAYNGRGVAYLGLDNYRRAIADFDEAIRIIPKFARAYSNRALAYEGVGDFEKSIRDVERAIEIDGAPRIRRLQSFLHREGHYSGQIDGVFDHDVRDATIACIRDPKC